MGIGFQEEILLDILSRLPMLPLLRFKCVSKFWKTLISDPYFIMKHQSHHKNDLNSQKLLVVEDMTTFFSSSLSTVQLVEDVQNLDCVSNIKPFDNCNIYGCCDGLVLLGFVNRYDKQLLLWNPSTRESTVLPHPEFTPGRTTFGLGYDATSDGYMILKLDRGSDDIDLPASYEILALKSGSWRKIRNFPTMVCPNTGYVLEIDPIDADHNMEPLAFLHGAFHWLGLSYGYSLVSFSSSDKVFREIPLLEPTEYSTYNMRESDYGVSVLGGMICFYCTYCSWQMEGTFKLWVMKDYGVKESWTEVFTLQEAHLCSIVPKYRFADGEVLLCCRLNNRSVFRTSKGPFGLWPQIDIYQEGIVYIESLISPKSLC
ncbi:F-box/kelch-repeat protein At3g23880-like isoform X1 [Lycium ferocissimum]|uniref:F-box/kelch-repeat protein At3g23880-like isoform X1 n=1 Tax=Lycium ferocissimum TaxID=112874 RepID=UPI002815A46E|nr:F-box/kelch-repeat protein At3g23880-like isoform X1 [Lycium ferocissimum]XP_059280935.1 F-box/kelch-repeat protein At3g23880-like isoform X1 [Lycium ferocissimum]